MPSPTPMIRGLQQIALVQHDLPRAIAFYRDTLGLSLVLETGGMAFFMVGDVRVMLTPPSAVEFDHANSVIYLDVADIHAAYQAVTARGAHGERPPMAMGRTPTHEVWMAFIRDPEGNLLGLAEQRPLSALSDELTRAILTVRDFPRPGVAFKDITPVLQDPALFARTTAALAAPWQTEGITHVLAIESRGFLFGAPVAQHLRAALVPVRKPGKLPRARITESYTLEYGTDTLECHADAIGSGARVLIVDDVLATGGTAAAVVRLVGRAGATMVGISAVIDLSFLPWRSALDGIRAETLVRF